MNRVCPNCGFPGASIRRDGLRQCKQCHGTYQAPVEYPDPPQQSSGEWSGLGATGGSGFPARVFIPVGAMAVIILAGVLFIVFGAGSQDAPSYYDESPAQRDITSTTRPEPPVKLVPAAEVHYHGANGLNGTRRWWIVEYRNTGNVALAQPHVRVAVSDDVGNELKTAESNSTVREVPPGESVWMTVDMANAPEGPVRFEPVQLKASSGTSGLFFTVPVQDIAEVARERESLRNYPYVTGRVENTTEKRFRVAWVLVMGWDANGKVVALAQGLTRPMYVKPGESTTFKILTGAYRDGEVVRWTAKAFAVTMP